MFTVYFTLIANDSEYFYDFGNKKDAQEFLDFTSNSALCHKERMEEQK